MILLLSNQNSLLTPTVDCKYYTFFFRQYTLISVSNLVSQCYLIPPNNRVDKVCFDNEIQNFIESIPEETKDETQLFKMLSIGMNLDQGTLIQESEKRSFLSDIFYDEARKQEISSRELVVRELNASAFLNYFTLLESSIKRMYFDIFVEDVNKQLNGGIIIEASLNKILKHKKIKCKFEKQLALRSRFFLNFKVLVATWGIINKIRIRKIHYNCYFDDEDIFFLKNKLEDIAALYAEGGEKNCSFTFLSFCEKIEETIVQIETDRYILFNDAIENIIRNTSIYVMETLYLVWNSLDD
jgi:hypothetical protein